MQYRVANGPFVGFSSRILEAMSEASEAEQLLR